MLVILPGLAMVSTGIQIGMPQVQVFADVHRSADSMWRELGSFQGIARWHPRVKAVDGEGEEPGATRTLETSDGLRWVEHLTQRDPSQRFYCYEATSTELPISDFRGEFRIRDDRPRKCTVIWTARFVVTSGEEKKVSDRVRDFFLAGAGAIEKHYAARPVAVLRRRVRTMSRRR
jgi:Polyketide cyclase / dehydrase and lipid transport